MVTFCCRLLKFLENETWLNLNDRHPCGDRWGLISSWAMKKWPDLSMIFQRVPSHHQDLSMICQWSSSLLHSRQGFLKVSTKSKTISMIAKGSDLSMNAQGTLNVLIDFPMISQRSFNERRIFPPQKRNGWQINERTRISHRNSFIVAFERSTRDQANFRSPNDLHPV